jgi:DegV family protein with EDD domain
VAVVTDSSATVPAKLVRELDIRIVPIPLVVNGRTFRDGVDITATDVYRLLRHSKDLPTTSAPSVGDFLRTYTAAAQEASGIVSIHVPPKLSATYQAAATASELVDGVPVHVVDCETASMGQGFVVLEAARAAKSGASLEAVVARAREVAAKVNVLATLDTVQYLHRGGRIGGATALLGSVLQIKPVLSVAGGHVDVFAKPRTRSKAVRLMLEQMTKLTDGERLHVAILHAAVPEEAEALRQQVDERFDCAELYVNEFTAITGAHTGPGVLCIVYYAE